MSRSQAHLKPVEPLQAAVEEAKLILSRHDGIHLLHADCQALILMQKLAAMGRSTDERNVSNILNRMRHADRTGVYPIGH